MQIMWIMWIMWIDNQKELKIQLPLLCMCDQRGREQEKEGMEEVMMDYADDVDNVDNVDG